LAQEVVSALSPVSVGKKANQMCFSCKVFGFCNFVTLVENSFRCAQLPDPTAAFTTAYVRCKV